MTETTSTGIGAPAARTRPHRTVVLSTAGLVIAVIAEACSVGLTGISGWFIASCSMAGAGIYSTFSYLDPSGAVRAFALGRIATGYASRVVLHSAALHRIGTARLAFYDRAATEPDARGTWSGLSLDRVMADADTDGMALIQATAPMVIATAMTIGGCAAIVLAGFPLIAAIVAASAALCAASAFTAAGRADDPSPARSALRTELVTASEAWVEMASLGATGHLAERILQRLTAFEDSRQRTATVQARATATARAITAVAVTLSLASAVRDNATVPALVFLALLTTGVLGYAERVVAAAHTRALSQKAVTRLASADHQALRPPSPGLAFHTDFGPEGLAVSRYLLPATPMRAEREIAFSAQPGHTVFVTGPSGSGKTTLLDAVASALRERDHRPQAATVVLADEYLFTGTVADNIRMAVPQITDHEIIELLADMLLDRSGLTPQTHIGIGGRDLSGGEQRRLHIARALTIQPDVLLLDEPATGLDAATSKQVLTAIRRRLPRAVLVLATHEPPDAAALSGLWTTVPLSEEVPTAAGPRSPSPRSSACSPWSRAE